MKTLSLLQPWASLMVTRWPNERFAKMFETRSWPTQYRGPIAIHSSKGLPPNYPQILARHLIWSVLSDADLPRGCVLGVGRLVDCLPVEKVFTDTHVHPKMTAAEIAFGDYTDGRFAWLIEDMTPLKNPVPAKGALGLWNWEPCALAKEILCSDPFCFAGAK